MMHEIEVKPLDPRIGQTIQIPSYATPLAAGMDLPACVEKTTVLEPGECRLISTGLALYIRSPYYMGLIVPRSGLGHKHGIVLGNGCGVIDADFQGELKISCLNRSLAPFTIEPGDRLAQLIFQPVERPNFKIVDTFSEKQVRSQSGFGSTGIRSTFAVPELSDEDA